ncbi:unnamed protein product, partial [Heterotrigona itama]
YSNYRNIHSVSVDRINDIRSVSVFTQENLKQTNTFSNIVTDLCKNIFDKSYTLCIDNSITKQADKNTHLIGISRKNRKENPNEVNADTLLIQHN